MEAQKLLRVTIRLTLISQFLALVMRRESNPYLVVEADSDASTGTVTVGEVVRKRN